MRKTISFLILSNTGDSAKQITASRLFLWFLNLFIVICLICIGAVIYDYYHLKQSIPQSFELEKRIANHLETIKSQQKQIQAFAGEINSLKSKLVTLNRFEEKIRIIANIKSTGQESLFGVGGTIPEDLDTQISNIDMHTSLIRDMHEQVQQLDQVSTSQGIQFEALINDLEDKQNLLACTPAIQPTTGWITSGFGYRISPFTGKREFHKALDIATKEGTLIVATANGTITFVGKKGMLGNVITVDHGHGMITRYAHIKKALKKPGDTVKRGDSIALVGSTGRTTGPHLHYEVLLNGIRVNPKKYILN